MGLKWKTMEMWCMWMLLRSNPGWPSLRIGRRVIYSLLTETSMNKDSVSHELSSDPNWSIFSWDVITKRRLDAQICLIAWSTLDVITTRYHYAMLLCYTPKISLCLYRFFVSKFLAEHSSARMEMRMSCELDWQMWRDNHTSNVNATMSVLTLEQPSNSTYER